MTVRPATREDIEAFSDMPNKPTIRAWVGEVDGEIVGLAGFAFQNGRWCGFCDLREKARPHKFTIARWAKRIIEDARKQGIRFVYAEADLKEHNAVRWLTSLGFEVDPRTDYLYRWRA